MNKELEWLADPTVRMEFSDILNGINDLRYTVTDVGVSSRVMSYWASEELLFEDFKDHKWRMLDLVSLVWMIMIKQMREYGIPFKTIKKIREELQPQDLMDFVLSSGDLREMITHLAKKDNQEVPDLNRLLEDPRVREEVKSAFPNFLKILILYALISKEHLAILVNQEGDIVPYLEKYREEYLKDNSLRRFLLGTYLTVSISGILVDFFTAYNPDFLSQELMLITKEECAVLKAIRLPGIKSVMVKLNQQGEFDLLEVTREHKVDRAAKLYEIFLQDGYEDITIKTQNGNVVHCQNTTRMRFNKLGTG